MLLLVGLLVILTIILVPVLVTQLNNADEDDIINPLVRYLKILSLCVYV